MLWTGDLAHWTQKAKWFKKEIEALRGAMDLADSDEDPPHPRAAAAAAPGILKRTLTKEEKVETKEVMEIKALLKTAPLKYHSKLIKAENNKKENLKIVNVKARKVGVVRQLAEKRKQTHTAALRMKTDGVHAKAKSGEDKLAAALLPIFEEFSHKDEQCALFLSLSLLLCVVL